jgi:hypothetical protein
MKILRLCLIVMGIAGASVTRAAEQLGQVDFQVSCTQGVRADFNRGVALLHDFWYQEAEREFTTIVSADPSCALAHWGIAMSLYHEIWDRPDEATLKRGREEMQKALASPLRTERERRYVQALADFYAGGAKDYQTRVDRYAKHMESLYRSAPGDVDAGAFYALALLASESPDDTSLAHEREALAVL